MFFIQVLYIVDLILAYLSFFYLLSVLLLPLSVDFVLSFVVSFYISSFGSLDCVYILFNDLQIIIEHIECILKPLIPFWITFLCFLRTINQLLNAIINIIIHNFRFSFDIWWLSHWCSYLILALKLALLDGLF